MKCNKATPLLWKELFPRCPPLPDELCAEGNGPGGGCWCVIVCVPGAAPDGPDPDFDADDCWRPQAICLREEDFASDAAEPIPDLSGFAIADH